MNRALLFAGLLGMGLMWGATIPLTKIAVSTGYHHFGLIFWQFVITTILLFFCILVRRSKLVWDRQHLIFFTVISVLGTLIPNSVSYIAAFHLPGGVMALIIAMVPVCALLIALILRVEKIQMRRMLGIALGLAAIALIVLPNSSLPDPAKAVFVLLALIAPLCYGLEGHYLALKSPADSGPVATLFGASLIGTAISSVLVWMTGSFINPMDGLGNPELALIASSTFHIFAYLGYILMVANAGAVFTSQVGYIVTPAGVLLSMAFLGETPSPFIWVAVALLLIAISLVQPRNVATD